MTGATGFLGSGLVDYFSRNGFETHALVRSPSAIVAPGVIARPYRLEDALDASALRGIDAVVHCAFIRHGPQTPDSSLRNIRGTLSLHHAATSAGSRFVFISTASARPGIRSEYGQHKLAIERALASDALVIRPGLVIGNGGLVRGLYDAVQRGIVPLIDAGRQPVQVVTPDEVGGAIVLALDLGLRGIHAAASADSVTLRHVAETLAERSGRKVRFVNIPWRLALVVALAAERLGIRLPLTTENLWGIRAASAEAPSSALVQAGWAAAPWNSRNLGVRFSSEDEL